MAIPSIGVAGKPVFGPTGKPVACDSTISMLSCTVCAQIPNLVPEFLLVTMENVVWAPGNETDPSCENWTMCDELSGLSFVVSFGVQSGDTCTWFGEFTVNSLTSMNVTLLRVTVTFQRIFTDAELEVVILTQEFDDQIPGCITKWPTSARWKRPVLDLPLWNCDTFEASELVNIIDGDTWVCHPISGRVSIIAV